MKKNIFTICIATAMSVSLLASCGGTKDVADTTSSTAPTQTAAADTTSSSASTQTASEVNLDFTIQNMTGTDFNGIYISESTKDDWEENIIEGSICPNGNEVPITFSGEFESDTFDIMCTSEKGDSICFTEINLAETSVVTLTIENGNPIATIQ